MERWKLSIHQQDCESKSHCRLFIRLTLPADVLAVNLGLQYANHDRNSAAIQLRDSDVPLTIAPPVGCVGGQPNLFRRSYHDWTRRSKHSKWKI